MEKENTVNTSLQKMFWVARVIPLEATGSPTVVRKLLANFSAEEVVLLGRKPKEHLWLDGELSYPNYMAWSPEIRGRKILAVLHSLFWGPRLIRQHRPDCIVAVYPDDASLYLGYMLHRKTGLPLYVYFIDLYQENKKGVWRKIADWLQPKVLRAATGLWAVNEGMQRYHKRVYGINSLLVPTAINSPIPASFDLPRLQPGEKIIIGYSGSLSRDRIQPFRELAKVLRRNPEKYELRFFSGQSLEDLKRADCYVAGMSRKFCTSSEELVAELKQCHLFYLPLTFAVGQDSREQLSTAFGIKAYEYMLAGRPILIHCPGDYFTSSFFSERDAGYCLTELEEEAVEQCLTTIHSNYNVEAPQIVENARKALNQFRGSILAERIREDLKSKDDS